MAKSVNRKSPGGVVGAVAASETEDQALGSGLTAGGDSGRSAMDVETPVIHS